MDLRWWSVKSLTIFLIPRWQKLLFARWIAAWRPPQTEARALDRKRFPRSADHYKVIDEMTAETDLQRLLATMSPKLNVRQAAFVTLSNWEGVRELPHESVIGTFMEQEGITVLMDLSVAEQQALPIFFRAAWITLTVHSDLKAVGLTAAFATALGNACISCNVVAAVYHDHIFVPIESAEKAMEALEQLQWQAAHYYDE